MAKNKINENILGVFQLYYKTIILHTLSINLNVNSILKIEFPRPSFEIELPRSSSMIELPRSSSRDRAPEIELPD